MRYGRSCFTLAWLWRRSVPATVLGFSCCTRRGNKGFFFSWLCCLFCVCERSLSFAVVLHRLWRKGATVGGRFLESFHPRIFFLQLNERRVFGNQEKMSRWDSDDFSPRGPTFCEVLLAIILPPLGVFLKYGCAVSLPNFCFPFFFLFALPFRLSFHCFRFFSAVYPDSSPLEE